MHLRRPIDQAASEQIVLDQNALAVGRDYTSVGTRQVSDDGKLLAYSLDLKGDRLYTIQLKNLETGRPLEDVITDTSGEVAWAADNTHFFYIKMEPQTLRPRYVYRHGLGETKDTLVFDEKDERYNVAVYRSLSNRLIFIASASKESTEYSYLEANAPLSLPKLFQSRLRDVTYSVYDGGDRFYVLTNLRAENFRVVEVPLAHTSVEHWTDILPHVADTYVKDLVVFKTHPGGHRKAPGFGALSHRAAHQGTRPPDQAGSSGLLRRGGRQRRVRHHVLPLRVGNIGLALQNRGRGFSHRPRNRA